MENHHTLIALAMMMSGSTALAGYACPPSNSTGGGWTPPECVQAHKDLCADCGAVETVNMVQTDEASGLGAVAGAVVGGVIGNQFGKGKGRTVATVGGAVVGGVAGHYGEKMLRQKDRWDVIVLMEDGTHRTVSFEADPGYKAGDKVKASGGSLVRQ
jgi:outer membrane lipoprotein SlyB